MVTPVSTSVTVLELLVIGIPSNVKFASNELIELLTKPALVAVEAVRPLITALVQPTFCIRLPVTSATLIAFDEPLSSLAKTSLAVEFVSLTTEALTPRSALFTAEAMFAITVELESPEFTLTLTFVVFPFIVTEKVEVPPPDAVEISVPDCET